MKSFAATLLIATASASKPAYYNRYGGSSQHSHTALKAKNGYALKERVTFDTVNETTLSKVPRTETEYYTETINT